jgi:hypothetical protein
MHRFVASLVLAVMLAGLTACSSAESLINAQFPPIKADDHHRAGIDTAHAALAGLGEANLGFALSITDALRIIEATELKEKFGVTLALRGDRQLLFADVAIDRQFTAADFPDADDTAKALLDSLAPQVKGKIAFAIGVTSASAVDEAGTAIVTLNLLPLFRNISFEKLQVANNVDLKPHLDVLTSLVNTFADNISGELTRAKFAEVSFPAVPIDPLDPSQTLSMKSEDGSSTATVKIEAKPIVSPVFIRTIAVLVDTNHIAAIGELAPTGTLLATAPATSTTPDFAAVQAAFAKAVADGLAIPAAQPGSWAAAGKALIALVANSAVDQADACFAVDATLAKQEFSQRIDVPDESTISCDVARTCEAPNCGSPAECPLDSCSGQANCDKGRVSDDCKSCVEDPFGNEFCAPDKACETRVFLENEKRKKDEIACRIAEKLKEDTCLRDALVRQKLCQDTELVKFDTCKKLGDLEVATCERDNGLAKIACETAKEKLGAIDGHAGNVDGSVEGQGNLNVCITKFALSPELDRIALGLDVDGSGKAHVGVKFTPVGVAGHLVCTFPFTENKTVEILLPEQPFELVSDIALETAPGKAVVKASIQTSELGVEMNPGPAELLAGSENMRLSCVWTNALLTPVAIETLSLIPEVDGKFRLAAQQDLSFEIQMPSLKVGETVEVVSDVLMTPKALGVAATLK